MQAFTAARRMGIPSKMVIFPEENHWILTPQNSLIWHNEFFSWLDYWLENYYSDYSNGDLLNCPPFKQQTHITKYMKHLNFKGLAFLLLLFSAGCAGTSETLAPQSTESQPSTPSSEVTTTPLPVFEPVPSEIFDNGRMWTFEYPPVEYFSETYNFNPDEAWFERARLGAVRLPNCSGSFVSANGLVMTNHHCARGQVSQVSLEGENLLDEGFYAETLADERPIEKLLCRPAYRYS